MLRQGVQSISDLILIPGLVNLDFADVTAIMNNAGYAHMGIGYAQGKDKAEEAARMAITSPLLETSIDGAKGVIVNITASADIGLDEIDTASAMITDQADPEANIIWGAVLDENMEDEMSVTVIATGFASFDGGKRDNASASRMSMTSSRTEMLRNQAASVAAAKDVAARKTGNVDVADDDDTFYDIMSIFNRK